MCIRLSVCLSLHWPQGRAMQKRLNRLRCCLLGWLMWVQTPKNYVLDGGHDRTNPFAGVKCDKLVIWSFAKLLWALVIHTCRHARCEYIGYCLLVCNCVCVWLKISPPRIKLAASNFARWFISVLGRESHILGNFPPPQAQNRTNRTASPCCNVMLLGFCDSIKFAGVLVICLASICRVTPGY